MFPGCALTRILGRSECQGASPSRLCHARLLTWGRPLSSLQEALREPWVLHELSARTETCFLSSSQSLSSGAKHIGGARKSYFLVSVSTLGNFNEELTILHGLNLGSRVSWKYKNVTWVCLHLGNPCWSNLV